MYWVHHMCLVDPIGLAWPVSLVATGFAIWSASLPTVYLLYSVPRHWEGLAAAISPVWSELPCMESGLPCLELHFQYSTSWTQQMTWEVNEYWRIKIELLQIRYLRKTMDKTVFLRLYQHISSALKFKKTFRASPSIMFLSKISSFISGFWAMPSCAPGRLMGP